jgi:hypothetical protein
MSGPPRLSRVFHEGKFVLGAAAVGCLVGACGSLLLPPLPWVAHPAPGFVQTIVRLAHGVGLGWWGGLFWGVFAVLAARGQGVPWEPARLAAAGSWAAAALLGCWGIGLALGATPKVYAWVGVAAALLVTKVALGARRHDRG